MMLLGSSKFFNFIVIGSILLFRPLVRGEG